MTLKEWEEVSESYDELMGEGGDDWHRGVIDPTVIRLLGEVSGKDILDLGCGNGYFSRKLARQGAKVVAIDSNSRILELARMRDPANELRIAYECADASNLTPIKDRSFDIVLSNMVLMSIKNAEGAIREAARVLRDGGKLVASISHPCFEKNPVCHWLVERRLFSISVSRRVLGYRSIFAAPMHWQTKPNVTKQTNEFHRPLSWYAETLRSSGFLIAALEEPGPNAEFLEANPEDGQLVRYIPLVLVIEAVKPLTSCAAVPRQD